jgi:hypothetical protein
MANTTTRTDTYQIRNTYTDELVTDRTYSGLHLPASINVCGMSCKLEGHRYWMDGGFGARLCVAYASPARKVRSLVSAIIREINS